MNNMCVTHQFNCTNQVKVRNQVYTTGARSIRSFFKSTYPGWARLASFPGSLLLSGDGVKVRLLNVLAGWGHLQCGQSGCLKGRLELVEGSGVRTCRPYSYRCQYQPIVNQKVLIQLGFAV